MLKDYENNGMKKVLVTPTPEVQGYLISKHPLLIIPQILPM